MYGLLARVFPRGVAFALTALWYVLLLVAIYALSLGPEGDFRYFRI